MSTSADMSYVVEARLASIRNKQFEADVAV